jgi:hypothetical protein
MAAGTPTARPRALRALWAVTTALCVVATVLVVVG